MRAFSCSCFTVSLLKKELQPHVAQRQSLQLFYPRVRYLEGYKRRAGSNHTVSKLFCKKISVTCGTCGRIGQTAGTDDDAVKLFPGQRITGFVTGAAVGNCAYAPVFRLNRVNSRPKLNIYTGSLNCTVQGVNDVGRVVRHRKNSVSALSLQMTPVVFKKIHHCSVVKGIHCAVQKSGISFNIAKKVFYRAGICHIASAFSGDKDLFSRLLIFLKNSDASAALCSRQRRHHSGCTAADNCYFITHMISLRLLTCSYLPADIRSSEHLMQNQSHH